MAEDNGCHNCRRRDYCKCLNGVLSWFPDRLEAVKQGKPDLMQGEPVGHGCTEWKHESDGPPYGGSNPYRR